MSRRKVGWMSRRKLEDEKGKVKRMSRREVRGWEKESGKEV